MQNLLVISTLIAVNAALNSMETIKVHMTHENEVCGNGLNAAMEDLERHVTFILFTRKVPQAEILTEDNVAKTSFNSRLNTTLIIHGYNQSGREDDINHTARAYIFKRDINVISVDWSPLAMTRYFTQAASCAQIVAKVVGELLFKLQQEIGLNLNTVHIIGLSLGAHVAEFSGQKVIELTGKKVSRITGLDPAGPTFEYPQRVKPSRRLDKTDARFVDVIHTDGGVYGSRQAMGHVDFFPNGGYSPQPGCFGAGASICGHIRALWLFSESIYNDNFVSHLCESWADFQYDKCTNKTNNMGEHVNQKEFGSYFLLTKAESPYAKG